MPMMTEAVIGKNTKTVDHVVINVFLPLMPWNSRIRPFRFLLCLKQNPGREIRLREVEPAGGGRIPGPNKTGGCSV